MANPINYAHTKKKLAFQVWFLDAQWITWRLCNEPKINSLWLFMYVMFLRGRTTKRLWRSLPEKTCYALLDMSCDPRVLRKEGCIRGMTHWKCNFSRKKENLSWSSALVSQVFGWRAQSCKGAFSAIVLPFLVCPGLPIFPPGLLLRIKGFYYCFSSKRRKENKRE